MSPIHLILVSRQTIPNISPILDERFRPATVIMLVSPEMEENCQNLINIYKPRGIKTLKWKIDDAWNVEHISNRILELLSDYEHEDIILNATGGTKPMSIAAYEVFRTFKKKIFYVHSAKDRLIWMYPHEQTTIDLADRIKIPEYFKAYGADKVHFCELGIQATIRKLNQQIIDNIEYYSRSLVSLNYFASTADNSNLTSQKIGRELNGKHDFWDLVELFKQSQILEYKNYRLYFKDEESRFICNGGWLELYAHSCCLNLKQSLKLQDVSRSVEVIRQRGQKQVKNELDVVLLKDNRLYLMECKTRRYKNGTAQFNNTLYKLDSLADQLAGMQTRSMIISYYPMHDHHRRRADELKINHCCYTELQNLEQNIEAWVLSVNQLR